MRYNKMSGVVSWGLNIATGLVNEIKDRSTDQSIAAADTAKRLREETARESTNTMLAVGGMSAAGILVLLAFRR